LGARQGIRMFDWLMADTGRLWVFIALCVITIFLVAGASLMDLFWEVTIPAVVGLVVSAQYGFFIGLMVFTLAFLVLYIWGGRPARVKVQS
jgi:hypothetical protein